MLSDKDIFAAIESGELIIDPYDKANVRPAGLSLHLGGEIVVPEPVELIDIKKEIELPYKTVEITEKSPFILKPGDFVLGHTEELITVGTTLGFIIEGRSTWARLGMSVEQSATIVDPGHTNRTITLEIYNCGPSPITLYKNMSIARAAIFRLSSKTIRSYDSYARYAKNSKGVSKPIIREKSQ